MFYPHGHYGPKNTTRTSALCCLRGRSDFKAMGIKSRVMLNIWSACVLQLALPAIPPVAEAIRVIRRTYEDVHMSMAIVSHAMYLPLAQWTIVTIIIIA